MKYSGKLSGEVFSAKSEGKTTNYSVVEKVSERTTYIGNDEIGTYRHVTLVAFDDSGERAGTIERASGNSFLLNTNNK